MIIFLFLSVRTNPEKYKNKVRTVIKDFFDGCDYVITNECIYT